MRILICGSRIWNDYSAILQALADEVSSHDVTHVIEGEAPGADLMGRRAATELSIQILPFPANWKLYGKSAGLYRNREMLVKGAPDLVLAFQIAYSRGTMNMIDLALDVAIPAKVFRKSSTTDNRIIKTEFS